MEVSLAVLDAERLQREVHIRVPDHRSFFGNVVTRERIAGDGEGAAVPGVDGGFGASEGVGAVDDKLGAKKLGSAG